MPDVNFNCLPTMIGSLPFMDPQEACGIIARFLPEIPVWPQLPRVSPNEHILIQYSEGFPGLTIDGEKLIVDPKGAHQGLHDLYEAYIANNPERYGINPDHSAGLYAYLKYFSGKGQLAAKGQVVGPLTFGLSVTDTTGKAIFYDETLGDAVPRFLKLKAMWQERQLSQIAHRTIMFIDEPYMASYGASSHTTISAQQVIDAINEVFSGLSGLKGIHCCANTDWSVLLRTNMDILSFDAYGFAGSLALFPKEVGKFLLRPGAVAWGIVPTDSAALGKETVSSLKDRLEEAIAPFDRYGIPFREVLKKSLLTPSCGLATLTPGEVIQALELLSGLSKEMRKKYF